MIYSNDESDKELRKRNFYFTVYILPIAAALLICITVYVAFASNYISRVDEYFGFILSPLAGFLIYLSNTSNWLKMPDGTYYNVKKTQRIQKEDVNEPAKYDAEYFYSKSDGMLDLFLGAFVITAAVLLKIRTKFTILLLMPFVAGGFYYAYRGISRMRNKTAQLKLSKKGLWTRKLGFVSWKDISSAQVFVTKYTKDHPVSKTILKIYLTGTVFSEANEPDEELDLTDIENNEQVVNTLEILRRNQEN